MENKTIKTHSKILTGTVVSARMQKTVVVKIDRLVKHRKYGKRFIRSKHYLAHDEVGKCRVGDRVKIKETRPLSRRKSFIVIT